MALFTAWDKAISAESAATDWKVVGDRDAILGWEMFTLMNLPNGNVAIKTSHGKWLSARAADENWVIRGVADEINGWEQFTLELQGPEHFSMKTAHGRYVVADPKDYGYLIRADRNAVGSWEQFRAGRDIQLQPGSDNYAIPIAGRMIISLIINGFFPSRIGLDPQERGFRDREQLIHEGIMTDAPEHDRELASRTA